MIFSDFVKPSVRLSAIMELSVIYIFTHDSIGVGEDGPTHQPVEQLIGLRAIPGLNVFRPADANEVAEAWKIAIEHQHEPSCMILSRQNLPTMDRTNSLRQAACGKAPMSSPTRSRAASRKSF